jgi:hypothetical protein
MNKKFILLFLVLFILFIYSRFFFKSITGFISEFLSLSLSVKSTTEGRFIYFSYPSLIYLKNESGKIILSQNATFNVTFMNTGNFNISGRIVIYVKNSTLHTLGTYYDDYFYLSPLGIKNFSATYQPNVTETYWVIANATYNSTEENKTTVENATFDVLDGLNVRMTVSTNQNVYCLNETVNVTTKLENIGYFNVTGNLSSKIIDQWKNIKKEENWLDINLSVNEIKYFFMNYTVQNTDEMGDYRSTSNFNYDSHSNSSSGGLRIKKGEGILLTSPSSIEKTIYPGQSTTQNLHMWLDYACEDTFARLSTSTGSPGNWVNFSKSELFLGSNGYLNTTVLSISVPVDTEIGTYFGTVYVTTGKQQKQIPLTVYVGTNNLTSNIEFFAGPPGDTCLGDTLTANLTITTNYHGTIPVTVTYRLLNPLSTVVNEWTETIEVDEILEKNVSFTIPSNGIEGYYTFTVTAKYGSAADQSSLIFKVNSCVTPTTIPSGPSGGGGGVEVPVAPVAKPVYNLTLSLSTNILTTLLGNETSFFAYVKNTGTENVKSVRISIDKIPLDWVRFSPSFSDISLGETQTYLVTVSIPKNASARTYKLRVKATDKVESNTETLTLIVGKELKEVVDMLLEELKSIRSRAKETMAIESCVNTTILKNLYEDAELAYENGMKEYENKNYEKAINWFEYAIALEEKVINSADIILRIEIESLSVSQGLLPTKLEFNKQLFLTKNNIDAKEYKIICMSITKMRDLIKTALVFWFLIILLIILILLVILLKKKKKKIEELILPKLRLETVRQCILTCCYS